MQCLPGYDLVTVFNKLFVFCIGSPSQDLITSITFIIKQGMTQKAHVGTDLMRTSCLQYTLDQGDVSKTLQHLVMCDGMFTNAAININHHLSTVFSATAYMACHGSFIFSYITPNQGNI